jgi:hypothetical protein
VNSRYKLMFKIGSFGDCYKAADTKENNAEVCVKIESITVGGWIGFSNFPKGFFGGEYLLFKVRGRFNSALFIYV